MSWREERDEGSENVRKEGKARNGLVKRVRIEVRRGRDGKEDEAVKETTLVLDLSRPSGMVDVGFIEQMTSGLLR